MILLFISLSRSCNRIIMDEKRFGDCLSIFGAVAFTCQHGMVWYGSVFFGERRLFSLLNTVALAAACAAAWLL